MLNRFLISNDYKHRLLRTIVQGIIGVIVANLDLLVSWLSFSAEVKGLIVALVMAILSPVMATMGTTSMPEKDELPHDFYEKEGVCDDESE